MQKENKAIFLQHISKENKKYLNKFMNLEGYRDYLYEFFINKKPAELEYLYKLASAKDKKGEMRIPGSCFPYFSEIPHERLKILEPVIMSKNYLGGWNYSASFILSLGAFNDKQLALMSKLANYKVDGYTLQMIGKLHPQIIDGNKFAQKAETLNKIYGRNLQEINLFVNDKNDFYLQAKVSLDNIDNVAHRNGYKEVFAHIDYDFNPINADKNTNIDSVVKNLHTKIEKNCFFLRKAI